jgi:hypothetical protein
LRSQALGRVAESPGTLYRKEVEAMTQSSLNRTIARITGESVRHIRRLGFVLVPFPTRRDYRRANRPLVEPPAASPQHRPTEQPA